MKITERLTFVMAWIACAGMIFPASVFAGQPVIPQPTRIQDVALTSGTFAGQVVDQQGNAIAGTAVIVAQQGTQVTQTVTDENGRFQVSDLAGGVYQIAAADTINVCRVWSERSAPPIATDGLLVVSSSDVVRGQQCNTCDNGGGYAAGAPVNGGYVVNGPVNGGYVDGGYVDGGACGPTCDTCDNAGCAGGCGGVLGFVSNPWFIGAVVACAIAIPLAVSDDDDDGS